jgi:hypothetical protein
VWSRCSKKKIEDFARIKHGKMPKKGRQGGTSKKGRTLKRGRRKEKKRKEKKRTYLSLRGRARAAGGGRKRPALVGELLRAGTRVRALEKAAFVAQLRIRQQKNAYEEKKP